MTCLAFNRYPRVILAEPVSQPPRLRHSSSSSGPAARWIAPSTPPPPSKVRFAAFTMASTERVVMSATRMSQVAGPIAKVRSGEGIRPSYHTCLAAALRPGRAPLRPLGAGLGGEVDRRALADIVEMLAEEIARRGAPALEQHFEEIEVGAQLALGGQLAEGRVERNPVHVDAPVLARRGAVRQAAL